MEQETRKSGVDVIRDLRWGTHICQFYKTKEDLIDILVPYFKAGLESNEFCIWFASEPLGVEDVKASLGEAVNSLDDCIKKGQIEILDAGEWYTKSVKFNSNEVLQGWVKKEKIALEKGFDGLRLAINTFRLEIKDWKYLTDYEVVLDNVIGKARIIATCSYALGKCGAAEVIDVVSNHELALVRQEGAWRCIETGENKRVKELLAEEKERLEVMQPRMGDGMITTDMKGNVVLLNRVAEQLTGWSQKEAAGVPIGEVFRLIDERTRRPIRAPVLTALKTGRIIGPRNHTIIFARDGTEQVIADSYAPIRGEYGKTLGVVLIFRKITQL